jgi:hypothetical protein
MTGTRWNLPSVFDVITDDTRRVLKLWKERFSERQKAFAIGQQPIDRRFVQPYRLCRVSTVHVRSTSVLARAGSAAPNAGITASDGKQIHEPATLINWQNDG